MPTKLLTCNEVAAIFRVSHMTIRRWAKSGLLSPVRMTRKTSLRFTQKHVEQVIRDREKNVK